MISRHFLNCNIAGYTYYDGIDVFYELKIGTELQLKAEPENQFDAYAVAIYFGEAKLGYIPKGENKQINQFLQLGYTDLFEVKINQISTETHTERTVGVVVRISEKKEEKKSKCS
jgi:hypothetical protein